MTNIHHHIREIDGWVYLFIIDHDFDHEFESVIINRVTTHGLQKDGTLSGPLNKNTDVISENMYDDCLAMLLCDGVY